MMKPQKGKAIENASTKTHETDLQKVLLQSSGFIKENITGDTSITRISEQTGFSKYLIRKSFRELMGITPKKYIEECRIEIFKRHLKDGVPIPRAIYLSGKHSQSWQYGNRNAQLGMSVKDFRQGGKNVEIKYFIIESFLGRILVAETQKGVCSVSLSDSDEFLEAQLQRTFPNAHIKNDASVKKTAERVIQHINGNTQKFDLDITGTSFQRKVWQALSEIPYGETRSYEEIAQITGNGNAQRAIANACAKNPVSLIIPCHRVIRKNGELGGYGHGLDKKSKLLKFEKSKKN